MRPHSRRLATIPMIRSCRGLVDPGDAGVAAPAVASGHPPPPPPGQPSPQLQQRKLRRWLQVVVAPRPPRRPRGGGELPEAVAATATEPEMRHGLLPTQRQLHRRRRRAPAPTAVLLCCRRQPPLAQAWRRARRSQNRALPALACLALRGKLKKKPSAGR